MREEQRKKRSRTCTAQSFFALMHSCVLTHKDAFRVVKYEMEAVGTHYNIRVILIFEIQFS